MRKLIGAMAVCAGLALTGGAQAATLGVMPLRMLDTSGEDAARGAAHAGRMEAMAGALEHDLGARYSGTVLLQAGEVDAACETGDAQCLLDLAAAAGADEALFLVVVKTSELIMRMYAQLVEVPGGTVLRRRELNFRGDTDESWQRAGRFLAKNLQAE
ncbi:DUF2380 domain-containing protein [Oceanicella sp. SM1341]|uniref:DUF2380 domain-containing protein n=1 Tax=Oceanicella sp. SM1341 TaxID=1548889 RepID=UPI000E4FE49A|nr:DUF2380 domain-containing protein [Oceanicella sp. SM1341]